MAYFYIVVGTVMGTAHEVAMSITEEAKKLGHKAHINTQFKAGDLTDVLEGEAILMICSSNTGMGDLPDNIIEFYRHLTNDFPRIAGKPYLQINLGDSSYPNFGQAGQTLNDAMVDLGAHSLAPMLTLDASEDENYDVLVRDWLNTLLRNL